MVNQIGMNSYGYYNYRNNLATRPVAFKGQEAITHEVKNSLTAENDKKNADSAATLMLGGGILATLSAAVLYVLTRGKGSKAATEVAEKAATKATNSVKIDPEVKFIETIEKNSLNSKRVKNSHYKMVVNELINLKMGLIFQNIMTKVEN